jgi:hypothetical protein
MSVILPVIVYGNNLALFSAVLNVLLVSTCPLSASRPYPLAERLSESEASTLMKLQFIQGKYEVTV